MNKNINYLLSIAIFSLLIVYLLFGVSKVNKGSKEESYLIIKDAINRSAVQCYAVEGYFPPNIEYLEKNYGLVVDYDKYIVSYNVFASNIMPDIEVFIK
ncbi:MAG: hypothetical protein PHE29_06480 [Tissierellia bacterium]|nr:hypothetical protein [Tissierellia bacterium]MDD4780363.1 hypothetical protein [Tissierellia bacterium]